ncbi:response regulator [Sunxiuqinia sp. A32]|uniref:response regulator n=1 Tax=Sunxiuqinia sp. A32 TaxID=3461496 RepID=UPI00404577B9
MSVPNNDLSGKTVLVVEDNETSRIYFEAALKKTHVKALWAKNGREAIDVFQKEDKIDLILMDLNMPEMDGFEATRRIRKLDSDVPIIVQSAYILSGEEQKSYEAGCDEFLSKPIRLNNLLDAIYRHLK